VAVSILVVCSSVSSKTRQSRRGGVVDPEVMDATLLLL
jgi:hypothetical protein